MAKTVKTAITIQKDDYALIEKMRKETGKSRSEIIMRPFHEWVKKQETLEKEKRYEEAYRRMPETKEEQSELDAWLKLSGDVAKDYPWK
jgi:metal-responsive CopG/Arc/MetJ family transcriptional regulator